MKTKQAIQNEIDRLEDQLQMAYEAGVHGDIPYIELQIKHLKKVIGKCEHCE